MSAIPVQNSSQSSGGGVGALPRTNGGPQNGAAAADSSLVRKTIGTEKVVRKEKKSIFKKPDQMPGKQGQGRS